MAADGCEQGVPVRVLVFAKAPIAHQTKTRLIPAVGAAGAAELHRRMLNRAVQTAVAATVGPVELWCTPSTQDSAFQRLRSEHGVFLERQKGSDLGMRMLVAARRALRRANVVVIMGADCPGLRPEHIRRAAHRVRHDCDAAFHTAEDGGFVLVALRCVDAHLFRRIQWGGADVMAQIRRRLLQLNWRWQELETLWDVDRPEDLDRLRSFDEGLVAGLV